MNYIEREISQKVIELSKSFPILGVTGPRQSGKTTLVKKIFPGLPYVSLEELDNRSFAEDDPRGFLATWNNGVIFDEAQRAPRLFSYIQGAVDEKKKAGQFIL